MRVNEMRGSQMRDSHVCRYICLCMWYQLSSHTPSDTNAIKTHNISTRVAISHPIGSHASHVWLCGMSLADEIDDLSPLGLSEKRISADIHTYISYHTYTWYTHIYTYDIIYACIHIHICDIIYIQIHNMMHYMHTHTHTHTYTYTYTSTYQYHR